MRFLKDRSGAEVTEVAVIIILIIVAAYGAIRAFGLRISALFDDLSIPNGGTISWKEMADRVAVTWLNVPEYSSVGSNTFQIEMFYDGQIHITWSGIGSTGSIVGLSEGNGIPETPFPESDISAAVPCTQEPGFDLDANPTTQNICTPDDAVYTIDVEQILAEDPQSEIGYYLRASVLTEREDYAAAVADLERVAELAQESGDSQVEATARVQRAMVMQLWLGQPITSTLEEQSDDDG